MVPISWISVLGVSGFTGVFKKSGHKTAIQLRHNQTRRLRMSNHRQNNGQNNERRSSRVSPLKHLLQILIVAISFPFFSTTALAEKINLNLANAEVLQYIPGIGPDKSRKIIKEREKVGQFSDIEQLLAIPGIGEKILQALIQYGSLNEGVSTLSEEMKENSPSN